VWELKVDYPNPPQSNSICPSLPLCVISLPFMVTIETMNTFFQKLLTLKYSKQCPDIKALKTQGDIITVYLEGDKVLSFKVILEQIKEDKG